MEEWERIRRSMEGLLAAREEAAWRGFLGLEIDLVGAYRRHPAAWHAEARQAIDEALARSSDDRVRAGLLRLRRCVVRERVRASAAAIEEEIAAQEISAQVEGPDGPLPLRAARRALRLALRRGRRALLADACGRALAAQEAKHSDGIARQQEILGAEGTTAAALAGIDDAALLEEARAALAASEDAHREILPWALAQMDGEAPAPLPHGDLADHDLEALRAAAAGGEAFPGGALELAARELVEAMGFDSRRGAVRLDLERRPLAAIGARVARFDRRAIVSLAPLGTPADWQALFGGIAVGLRWVSIDPMAPVEDARCCDEVHDAAWSAVFAGIVRQPFFLRRTLAATRRAAERAARLLAAIALLELRLLCAGALFERELWSRAPSRAVARTFGEIMAAATGARFDERRWFEGADVGLPASVRLRGLAIAHAIDGALRERCDEDWWRNPRTGPLLQGVWARGAAVEATELPAALGGGPPSLVAAAKALSASF